MTSRVRQGKHQITLVRALSKLGVASRSKGALLIQSGEVSVNGNIVRSPQLWVDPRKDKIALKGRPVHKPEFIYLAMNKPAGIITTRSDERGRGTVYDLLPKEVGWIFPVGRLDKESSGLLLFTNDTRFGETVTGPDAKIPKRYAVQFDKPLHVADRKRMESGMVLDEDMRTLPATVHVSKDDPATCEITLREGKNRQIRRMAEMLGYEVLALKRLSLGGIQLGSLKEGEVRRLTSAEKQRITGDR